MMHAKRTLIGVITAMLLTTLPAGTIGHADTIDGSADGIGRLPVGSVYDLTVLGRGGIPATGVDSVALNVTVTNPWEAGFLTVWPAGQPRPTASNLNFIRGQTLPNMVVVPVGVGGKVSLFLAGGSADVVVDVLGWFPTGGGFTGLVPARLLDSRADGLTVDHSMQATGALRGGTTFDLPVRGRGGIPATGAGTVVLNVTLINATDPTFLTVWPSGTARPTASNLNVVGGETRPNLVIVPLGASGDVSLYLFSGMADVAVDVLGWFPIGGAFTGLNPARLMDSRSDGTTVDGAMQATGALVGGTPLALKVAGRGGVPAMSTTPMSVALNVTVTNPTVAAFLTVYPTGRPRPNASNLNVVRGQTVPNMVMVPVGEDGDVMLYLNRDRADVVVDVLGYVIGTDVFVGVTPARLLETRFAALYVPLPTGQQPSWLEFDGTHLWGGLADGSLVRIDTASGATQPVNVPGRGGTGRVFADGRFLWMRGEGERQILRYEPSTGRTASFVLPFGMTGGERPAFDGRYLWYVSRYAVTRVDQISGAMRVHQVPQTLLDGVSDAAPSAGGVSADRYIWFGARLFGNTLGRFDTVTGSFAAIPLPAGHQTTGPWLVSDGSRVWTFTFFVGPSGERKALVWFDPNTGASGTIELPVEVWEGNLFLPDDGSMWITSTWVEKVAKVNLATGVTTLFDGQALMDPQGAIPPVDRFLVSASDGVNVWALAVLSGSLARFPRNL